MGKVIKIEKAGFQCVRIEGDHFVYTKQGIIRPVVIPDWKEIPIFIIKNNKGRGYDERKILFSIKQSLNNTSHLREMLGIMFHNYFTDVIN